MTQYISKEGLTKLMSELEELKNVKRKEVIERITKAKELGDLSENADYHDAKDEQGFIEGRIIELEHMIKNVVIVENNKKSDIVDIGHKVKILCEGSEREYEIVGSNEANPAEYKISNESPLGQAFLGSKVGDVVKVIVPKGEMECEILAIS
ncbi:transcription elongation factor GreA [Patescibacteria group bacterium]|nr:transcription elongation factor GreA [Patescibacteria group bacterium]